MALCNTCVKHNSCDGCRRFEETYKEEPSACSDYEKRKTHADRIRGMTDEELAEFLWGVWRRKDPFYKECVDGWLVPFYHWLKQEAAE